MTPVVPASQNTGNLALVFLAGRAALTPEFTGGNIDIHSMLRLGNRAVFGA